MGLGEAGLLLLSLVFTLRTGTQHTLLYFSGENENVKPENTAVSLSLLFRFGQTFRVSLRRELLLKRQIIIKDRGSVEKVFFFKGASSNVAMKNSSLQNLE